MWYNRRMKKIDSNSYAGRWVAVGLAPIALAGVLRVAQVVWGIAIPARLPSALLALGAIVLLGLGVLLVIELSQDRRLNAYHLRRRRTKLPLSTGLYECQGCGSQQVGREDSVCRACGMVFEDSVHLNK